MPALLVMALAWGIMVALAPLARAVPETWTEAGAMGVGRQPGSRAVLLQSGKVLVTGGSNPDGQQAGVDVYDPVAGTWSAGAPMGMPRAGHGVTVLADGRVLVSGGQGKESCEIYDPVAGTWTETGAMNGQRGGHTSTLLPDGRVLVTGGQQTYYETFSSVEIYDPATGTWSAATAMGRTRAMHTATLLQNGKVLVAGGFSYWGNEEDPTAEVFDPAAGTWSVAGRMQGRYRAGTRKGHTATLLQDGKVFVAGGYDAMGNMADGNLYDPVTNSWTITAAPMVTPRHSHAACLLPDGKVLVAGGYGSPYLADAEVYSPATDTWAATGPLNTGRGSFAAILLASGKVLAVGGAPTAEMYDPGVAVLTLSPVEHGGISGTAGAYPLDVEVSLVATPAPGYLFTGWTGDASGTANPLVVVMVSNKKIGAVFSMDLSDTDGDGLTAHDEIVLHGTNPGVADTDGDGLQDGAEVSQGSSPLNADTDGDGLDDSAEQGAGTSAVLADTDGDGLTDGQEVQLTQTNPLLADSDGNGTGDPAEDPDLDGLANLVEVNLHKTNPRVADTDGDGLSDFTEVSHPARILAVVTGAFTYPQAVADAAVKRGRVAGIPDAAVYQEISTKARQLTQGAVWIGLTDSATEGVWLWPDGNAPSYTRWQAGQPNGGGSQNHVVITENLLTWADAPDNYPATGYIFERVGLDPLDADTDDDGLDDGTEVNVTHSDPALADTDGDGLADGAEVNTYHSSPLLADTDGDGLDDRAEVVVHHSDPAVKDTDGDGFDDFFEVGTGYDPTLGSSTPDAVSSLRTAVEFRFNAADGGSYRIEQSTDLANWTVLENGIAGSGGVVTRFYSIEGQARRYFRAVRN